MAEEEKVSMAELTKSVPCRRCHKQVATVLIDTGGPWVFICDDCRDLIATIQTIVRAELAAAGVIR